MRCTLPSMGGLLLLLLWTANARWVVTTLQSNPELESTVLVTDFTAWPPYLLSCLIAKPQPLLWEGGRLAAAQ